MSSAPSADSQPESAGAQVILLVGLPGAGKTTLAHALKREIGAQILSRDDIRDAIFPADYLDYSGEQNQVATDAMLNVLSYLLKRGRPATFIIDGKPFSRAFEVTTIEQLVRHAGGQLLLIHCDAPLDVICRRLEEGLREPVNVRAQRTPDKAIAIFRSFEKLQLPHLHLDMTRGIEELVSNVIAYRRDLPTH